jgi:hypothetical protein
VVAADNCDGRRQQRQTMKAADDDGTQGWAADYEGEEGEWAASNDCIRHKADKPAVQ